MVNPYLAEGDMPRQSEKKTQSLEEQYQEYFKLNQVLIQSDEGSLEQPSPLMIVPSLTTYGAYEEPVVGQ